MSNWATFYGEVKLAGARQVAHLPIVAYDSMAGALDFAIIYRASPERLALVCAMPASAQAAFEEQLGNVVERVDGPRKSGLQMALNPPKKKRSSGSSRV